MRITFDRMTKGRRIFECHACGHQEVTYVDPVRITHYCGGKTIFEAEEAVTHGTPEGHP